MHERQSDCVLVAPGARLPSLDSLSCIRIKFCRRPSWWTMKLVSPFVRNRFDKNGDGPAAQVFAEHRQSWCLSACDI